MSRFRWQFRFVLLLLLFATTVPVAAAPATPTNPGFASMTSNSLAVTAMLLDTQGTMLTTKDLTLNSDGWPALSGSAKANPLSLFVQVDNYQDQNGIFTITINTLDGAPRFYTDFDAARTAPS